MFLADYPMGHSYIRHSICGTLRRIVLNLLGIQEF
nr:MAG TPA: hypothetical protein [Bacteriophage sp.]